MTDQMIKVKGMVLVIILIITGAISTSILLPTVDGEYSYNVNAFVNYEELITYFNSMYEAQSSEDGYYYGWGALDDAGGIGRTKSQNTAAPEAMSASVGGEEVGYSTTNIQVVGVDEPDIVKTDGKYLYVVSNNEVFIIEAYPPESAEIISTISLEEMYINNIFINDNLLVIFGSPTYYYDYGIGEDDADLKVEYSYFPSYESSTMIMIYDLSDIEDPVEEKTIVMDGSYFNARMIGDYIYVVSIEYLYSIYPLLEVNSTEVIPKVRIDNETHLVEPYDIYYIDAPDDVETTTHIAAIDLSDFSVEMKSFLLGYSQTLYSSQDNIFLASVHYSYAPLLRGISNSDDIDEMTIIHKISLNKGDLAYEGKGEVPGRILNQFSMDEYDGFFRIATTIGHVWDSEKQSTNNIYVLDSNLKIVGKVEDLAPGERIYSSRFMGEKAYLVTFKKIDPFFTIDLSDPYNPEVLGKLKIPGYSDYLHPYDENHIIGIGKDTADPQEDDEFWREVDFAWYQGLKIALFDVTDFENPKEVAKIIIGDRGTDSPALYDHKAFLFDLEKNLLVIPVNLYEISEEDKQGEYTGSQYGEFTYQGAYVYDLTIENGFDLKGRITHLSDEDMKKSGFYPDYQKSISRSLYIGDYLYTISNTIVKINDLDQLDEKMMISLE